MSSIQGDVLQAVQPEQQNDDDPRLADNERHCKPDILKV